MPSSIGVSATPSPTWPARCRRSSSPTCSASPSPAPTSPPATRSSCTTARPTVTSGPSPSPTASTSAASRTTTWPSAAAAPTSALVPTWPASRSTSSCTRCSPACPISSPPAPPNGSRPTSSPAPSTCRCGSHPVADNDDLRSLLGEHPGLGLVQRHLQDLGGVQRPAVTELGDLGAAAEAVGHHQGVGGLLTDPWHQHSFGAGDGYVVVPALEAEVAGQAAASRVEELGVEPHRRPQLLIG